MDNFIGAQQCNGYIDHNGHCTKCGAVSLTSSSRCIRTFPEQQIVVQNCSIPVVRDRFNEFVKAQKDIPDEILDVINERFWDLI